MNKTIEQIEKELDQKIPRDVVSLRDGGGGRKLSYLEGHYVIDRLNKVFGHLNWTKEITDVRQVVNTTPKGEFPAYLVKVTLVVKVITNHEHDLYTTVIKEGYGYGSDKSGLNAHELAIKEAVTDALKVAAKDLGMSMGLALYDKTQENVEDAEQETKVVAPVATAITTVVAQTPDVNNLHTAIRSYFKVAEAQKRSTKESFKSHLEQNYSVEKVAELNPGQSQAVLNYLIELTK